MSKKSVQELIARINADGYLVSSIWQADFETWHVGLRAMYDWTTAHGEAKSLYNAIARAWNNRPPPRGDSDWAKLRQNPKPSKKIERVR